VTDKTIADVLDKSIDKLSGGAAEVAKAVKHIAPHAWEVAVRQQIVEGITTLAMVALAFCTWLWVLHKYRAVLKKCGGVHMDERAIDVNAAFIMALCTGCVGCTVAVYGFNVAPTAIQKLITPEYYAAWEFIDAVKP
jgi:hypothetical protein